MDELTQEAKGGIKYLSEPIHNMQASFVRIYPYIKNTLKSTQRLIDQLKITCENLDSIIENYRPNKVR